jgi:hypothetical protein
VVRLAACPNPEVHSGTRVFENKTGAPSVRPGHPENSGDSARTSDDERFQSWR